MEQEREIIFTFLLYLCSLVWGHPLGQLFSQFYQQLIPIYPTEDLYNVAMFRLLSTKELLRGGPCADEVYLGIPGYTKK